MQFTTTGNLEFVRVFRFFQAHCHVVQHLAHQTFANLAAGQILAAAVVLVASERRVVDLKRHADGWLVHHQHRQLLGRFRRTDGVGNAKAFNAGNRDDVARFSGRHLAALKAHEAEHLQYLAATLLAFAIQDYDRHVGAHAAALDTANPDQTDVAVVVELADAHLERSVRIDFRRMNVLHDRLVERRHVARAHVGLQTRVAVQRGRVHDREIKLLFAGAETVEQVERGV